MNRYYSDAKKKQKAIFDYAKDRDVSLDVAISHFDSTYNDLVYENSHIRRWEGPSPKVLADYTLPRNNIPIVSFFSGCGGIDLGFETAGYEHLAAFEFNELCCKTLRKNRPGWNVYGPPTSSGDISKLKEIISILDEKIGPNFDGVFVGGPPCQPFSIASNQRFSKSGENFKRVGFKHEKNGGLLFDYVRLIQHYRPACFLIENVPGLRDIDGGEQLLLAITELKNSGYAIEEPRVLNAAHYGVPQYRERLILVGNRLGKSYQYPDRNEVLWGAGSVLDISYELFKNCEIRAHKLASVERYVKLDYGQRDKLGRVDRLDPCLPSKTVIAGGTNGGGRSHLHPEVPRTLSVRECARLQTFPDNYIFVGPTARQFTQVGNAVPPILATQIGASIANEIFSVGKTVKKKAV